MLSLTKPSYTNKSKTSPLPVLDESTTKTTLLVDVIMNEDNEEDFQTLLYVTDTDSDEPPLGQV